MKKLLTLLSIAVCCITFLSACGSKDGKSPSGSASAELKEGQSLQAIIDRIDTEVGISMPSDVDDNVLTDICYIPMDAVEDYAGKITFVNVSSDNVIAVKAKEGQIDTVKAGLTKRLEDVQESFEQYLPEQYEKAKKGQILIKGNYAFFLIIGESSETMDQDMEKAISIINEAFQ